MPAQQAVIRQWRSGDGAESSWSVVFDTVVSEDVTLRSKVTEDPVASGSPINDHMYDLQPELTISAVVSNVLPWTVLDGMSAAELEAAGIVPSDPFWSSSVTRAQMALARLKVLQKSHEPFYVQTALDLFPNMVCEEIHYVTDVNTAEVLAFTAKLKGVRIVYTQAVLYPIRADKKTKKQASKPVEKGHADAPEPTDEELHKKAKSLLLKVLGM